MEYHCSDTSAITGAHGKLKTQQPFDPGFLSGPGPLAPPQQNHSFSELGISNILGQSDYFLRKELLQINDKLNVL